MQNFVDSLIANLAAEKFGEDVFNEYTANGDTNNAIRRANLQRYLLEMAARKPKIMLLMEAPGYRGCRLTGVPVTSRKILMEGIPELEVFGEGYQTTTDIGFEDIQGEQSATIVWGTLAELGIIPLIWNSFPFHPRKADNPRSNRAPRSAEKILGQAYLSRILEAYQPALRIAVGNVAESTFAAINISCEKVRHPAQGGKNDFVAGLQALLANYKKS